MPIIAEREAQMRSMSEESRCRRGHPDQYKLKGPPVLKLQPGKKDFNLRGDTRGAYEQVARAFGVATAFDPDLVSRKRATKNGRRGFLKRR